ncbi:MAG: DUF4399 domain-containing protein [Verrucomicrobiota bacterium]|nr:DUF4399 domain-containing protein [Verrucomicrobiota bacterium]
MKTFILSLAISLLTVVTQAQGVLPKSKSAEGARAYIISPANGEVVGTSVKIQFGLSGMGVAPAGVKLENTGHHHLLLDVTHQRALFHLQKAPLPLLVRLLV